MKQRLILATQAFLLLQFLESKHRVPEILRVAPAAKTRYRINENAGV
jgi:hypothetical protein